MVAAGCATGRRPLPLCPRTPRRGSEPPDRTCLAAVRDRLGRHRGVQREEPPAAVWVDGRVEVRPSSVEGNGLFATAELVAGTVVVRLVGRLVSTAELTELLQAANAPGEPYVDTITVDEDVHLVLPTGTTAHYGNHSCEPNLWPVGSYAIAARHDVRAGDELTLDYATTSGAPGFAMACRCGSSLCRGEVTGDDWRRPELQAGYGDHWAPRRATKDRDPRRRPAGRPALTAKTGSPSGVREHRAMSRPASHRLQWAQVPATVRERVAAVVESPVVAAEGQAGGYGPGVAARCRLADGRKVFVKAASPSQNPETPGMMRREAAIVAGLPAGTPSPRLLHAVDDGTWVVLVFEEVIGEQPALPWDALALDRLLHAMATLASLRPPAHLPTVAERYGVRFSSGWRTLAAADGDAVVDPWFRRHLDRLASLEAGWEVAAAGTELVHGDVRSDNVLLTRAGDVVFVDWSSACVGQGWFDLVAMLPSIELEGGGSPEEVLALAGRSGLDRATLVPVVAALAGYFAQRGRLPDPPGLPTLRSLQRAQGRVITAWLRGLLDWS